VKGLGLRSLGFKVEVDQRLRVLGLRIKIAMPKRLRPQHCFRDFHCFGRIWKLAGFHHFLTDSRTEEPENCENSELPEPYKNSENSETSAGGPNHFGISCGSG
jgi:hypothetical protein